MKQPRPPRARVSEEATQGAAENADTPNRDSFPTPPRDVPLMVARLLAEGLTHQRIADEIGVSRQRVQKLAHSPRVMEAYRGELADIVIPLYSQSIAALGEQLHDGSPWVRQNAAREILARFDEVVTGRSSQEIVIRLEGMPQLGIPGADSAVDSDIEPIYVDSDSYPS